MQRHGKIAALVTETRRVRPRCVKRSSNRAWFGFTRRVLPVGVIPQLCGGQAAERCGRSPSPSRRKTDETASPAVVTANKRPFNIGGRWRVSVRSYMESFHVRVHAIGEAHARANCSARPSRDLVGRVAALVNAGPGFPLGPFPFRTPNLSLNRTARRRRLRAVRSRPLSLVR